MSESKPFKMKHFVNNKIMGHCRSSEQSRNEAGRESQTDFSQDSRNDVCKKPRPVPQGPCPGSQNAPESMYILKNCDRCQDYTVQPCNKKCKCAKRNTHCSGQCDITSQGKPRMGSQESLTEEVPLKSKSSRFAPDPVSYRGMGGTAPVCQLCGHEEIHQAGQSICPICNQKIQAAVDNYYVQCKGQCQQAACQPCMHQPDQQQPPPHPHPLPYNHPHPCPYNHPHAQQPQQPGQWHLLNGTGPPYGTQQQQGDQPFNIIVLQDCNNHALIDQLTTAINSGGGQMHMPTETQHPEYNNYPNNYRNQPLSGYIDYEFLDLNRKWYEPEREDRYDYGYDISPWSMDSYTRDGYEDDRYQNCCSFHSCDCSCDDDLHKKQGSWGNGQMNEQGHGQGQGQGFGQAHSCSCNCEFCRKGFESREKLAMLIAQALEIFICNHNAKNDNDKDCKAKDAEKKVKKNKKKPKRKISTEPSIASPVKKGESLPVTRVASRAHISAAPSPHKATSLHSVAPSKHVLNPPTSVHNEPSMVILQSQSRVGVQPEEKNQFFLPNCQEHRCKYDCHGACSRPPHNCGKGCKGHCRGPCSHPKSKGGGDGRNRSQKSLHGQRATRCQQCNQGEGRQWHEVGASECPKGNSSEPAGGCAACGPTKDRNVGGGKSALLGLSPIAHYRPGMLQFPVNYLLAGTNFRRSLVRTAAGVTLHQKPYVDMANAKDLPHFPCRKKSCSPPRPRSPKKWL